MACLAASLVLGVGESARVWRVIGSVTRRVRAVATDVPMGWVKAAISRGRARVGTAANAPAPVLARPPRPRRQARAAGCQHEQRLDRLG
jgi:hypothetical protein